MEIEIVTFVRNGRVDYKTLCWQKAIGTKFSSVF